MAKKFGLIKMQGFGKGVGLGGKPKAKPKLNKKAPVSSSFFGDDDDDEETDGGRKGVNAQIKIQQANTNKVVEKMKKEALAEDPTMYQYDEVYDDMQGDKGEKAEQRKKDFDPSFGRQRKEARYIQALKKSADIRKIDEERIFQMKLKKEADAEKHIYGDKEQFVTAAYKEKLAEMGRWKQEDARLNALEEATTVEGKKSMTSFYTNLLTKNLAMGSGDVAKDATSAYTIGSKRNEHIRGLEQQQKEEWDARQKSGKVDGEDEDEEELLRRTEESDRKRKRADEGDAAATPPSAAVGDDRAIPIRTIPETERGEGLARTAVGELLGSVTESAADAEKRALAEEATKAAEAERKKAEREAGAKSARERFLARKKAKEGK